MSPALSPAARAAGQRVTAAAQTQAPGEWRCTEPGCTERGVEPTYKARERALYHHIAEAHYEEGR